MNLTDLRNQIDLIDTQIIALLNQRWALAPFIIEAKASTDINVLDPEREALIIKKLQALSPKTPNDVIEKIWKEIMKESRRRQESQTLKV